MEVKKIIKELEYYVDPNYTGEYLDAAIKLLEKQIPKKIFRHPWNGIEGVPYDLCPSCENNLCTNGMFPRKKMNYCEKCGQKLDWS